MANLPKCSLVGCEKPVSKAGYTLCYQHWLDENKSKKTLLKSENEKSTLIDKAENFLSVTQLSELLNISKVKLNQVFLKLEWIEKTDTGWVPTLLGTKLHAQVEIGRNKETYVMWHSGITKSRVLTQAIAEYLAMKPVVDSDQKSEVKLSVDITEYRKKYPANKRADDGHMVRSRGELLIDNWLAKKNILHEYETKLPIIENVLCDFYIPSGKVYIEYWGLEDSPAYLARKKIKLEIYKKYNYKLIELQNKHVDNLNDYLPQFLLEHNVRVD